MQKAPTPEPSHSDWPAPHKRVRGERRQQMAKRLKIKYDAGASIRALAGETGRSYGHIHRLLHEAGADFRGRGGSRNRTNTGANYRRPERPAPRRRVATSQRAALAVKLKDEYDATRATIGTLAARHGLSYHLVRALLHEVDADIRQGSQA
ncbi:helix-turn-helix DNA binding domain protein [Streptomyces phage Gilgamesh]|uniref:Helix-turn-helix DNA binding domain protein n=1 Tax=Streptomyces phage Gilgamesh TaxID=2599890 RepID=A0A5J6TTM9_9CAUD|nr:helix-turn-helix DNA binding domain protein [Streptomyces phage Gilgamesh]QFG13229.1 helix-turn-helix DNA binding domain protein [Streptomyces phage Gilgamesh]